MENLRQMIRNTVEPASHPSAVPSTSSNMPCVMTNEQPVADDYKQQQDAADEISLTPSTSRGIKRRQQSQAVLREVGVSRAVDLSPKASKLYSLLQASKKLAINSRTASFRKRLLLLKALEQKQVLAKLSRTQRLFIARQLRNADVTKKVRRYTEVQKLLSLFFWKSSPRTYKLLSSVFTLPSPAVLRSFISPLSLLPGICKSIFNNLEQLGLSMKARDKLCCLIFDEICLMLHLEYNAHRDIVEGFSNNGNGQTNYIANYSQVWMLRGVHKSWKQPIAFTFSQHSTCTTDIVQMYKAIVKHVHACGFVVVASVCDQSTTNTGAIQTLLEESRADALRKGDEVNEGIIRIDSYEIVPLFDPPHLLKCIRNNFLFKDIKFCLDGTVYTASWSDIQKTYHFDRNMGWFRACPKLTDYHVLPRKIRKMKVSFCSQVFSKSLSGLMFHLCRAQSPLMSPTAQGTALLLKFFDELFDSVNGGWKCFIPGKPLRTVVTDTSDHLRFWNKARQVLESLSYVKRKASDRAKPVVLRNWMFTLRAFAILKNKLNDLGLKAYATRSFNQDPLENFFGQLRQHAGRNTNPSCSAFAAYFKTLVIRNAVTFHSKVANCEEDNASVLLESLKGFLEEVSNESSHPTMWEPPVLVYQSIECDELEVGKVTYVAGYIAETVLKTVGSCITCQHNLLNQSQIDQIHALVLTKEYKDCCLTFVNPSFSKFLTEIYNILNFLLPQIIHLPNIISKCVFYINLHCFFPIDPCPVHPLLKDSIIDSFSKITLYQYIRIVNNIILGKESLIPSDPIQEQAFKLRPK